jgi:hypothetical protein
MNKVYLEKFITGQLVEKFPAFYLTMVHYHVHDNQLVVAIVSQMSSICVLPCYWRSASTSLLVWILSVFILFWNARFLGGIIVRGVISRTIDVHVTSARTAAN